MGDAGFEIGVVENALQAVSLGHLILMDERLMRAAQWGRDIQTDCLDFRLGLPVAAAPSGRRAGGSTPTAGGFIARLKPGFARGPDAAMRGYAPGLRSAAGSACRAAIRVGFGANTRMQMHRRCFHRRTNRGETEGQDTKDGNVERTAHVGAFAEVRGES